MVTEIESAIAAMPAAKTRSAFLRIGSVSFALASNSGELVRLSAELSAFKAELPQPRADIQIDMEWVAGLRPSRSGDIFHSGALWNVSPDGEDFVFEFVTSFFGEAPYKRMRVDNAFCHAQISLNRELLGHYESVSPLDYPADELLITNHLAFHGIGVEVHGCGLIDTETGGHLFLGHSGAGKSTTARLWQSLRGPEILSDDRIILRLHDGELWMYGTPWHGEAAFASPNKSKLNRILVLRHGVRNQIAALPKARAVGELFARCFPPFHSAVGLERTVEFLNRALDAVPCYEFQFTPDARSIEAVLRFHD